MQKTPVESGRFSSMERKKKGMYHTVLRNLERVDAVLLEFAASFWYVSLMETGEIDSFDAEKLIPASLGKRFICCRFMHDVHEEIRIKYKIHVIPIG